MTQWFTRNGEAWNGDVFDVDERKGKARRQYEDVCHRCFGSGRYSFCTEFLDTCLECGQYKGVPGSGKGIYYGDVFTAEKLAKLNENEAKRNAKKAAKLAAEQDARNAKRDAFISAHTNLVAALRSFEKNDFVTDMLFRIDNGHDLTENQFAAITAMVAREHAKAFSVFVGEIGERVTMVLTVDRWIFVPTQFGDLCICLAHDQNGNKIVYKGSSCTLPSTGETATVTATIKEHKEYKGEKQTIIQRPKVKTETK